MSVASTMMLGERRIAAIIVGGSAGALQVIRTLLGVLTSDLTIPLIMVLHLPPRSNTGLRDVLQVGAQLPVRQIEDKDAIDGGVVYFAPPDYHLFVERGLLGEHGAHFALSVDAAVHFSRPSIDVLFESAADVYGGELLAMLLSGASIDGAAGLRTVHERGGLTVVQEPQSAEASTMPQSALSLFTPDYLLPPSGMASLLQSLRPQEKRQAS